MIIQEYVNELIDNRRYELIIMNEDNIDLDSDTEEIADYLINLAKNSKQPIDELPKSGFDKIADNIISSGEATVKEMEKIINDTNKEIKNMNEKNMNEIERKHTNNMKKIARDKKIFLGSAAGVSALLAAVTIAKKIKERKRKIEEQERERNHNS